ncbi:MAG: stage II sporulation protein SpoIID, partial [Myxococcota bacterium]
SPSPSLRPRLDAPPGDPALAPFREGLNSDNLEAWLGGTPPAYCARSRFTKPDRFRWERSFDPSELEAIGRQLGVGRPRAVEVLGRGPGGRVTGVRVVGSKGKADVLRELPVRRLFGNLRSGAFLLRPRKEGGRLVGLDLRGAGFGHGVGMCQMGAIGRAEAGQGAAEILRFYYSGASVAKLYD